jgi:hypothetical protein
MLADDLLRLSADVDELAHAIDEELGRGDAPWAAMRAELGERILPLSLKDGVVSPSERRLASLDRQRVRLRGVNDETDRLLAIQEQRSLTGEEIRSSRRLNRETEALRWELKHLFDEFERVRAIGASGRFRR